MKSNPLRQAAAVTHLFLIAAAAQSQTSAKGQAPAVETAVAVAAQFAKFPRPTASSTEFDHWVYNTLGFTAIHCWNEQHKGTALPKTVAAFKPTRDGTWTLPPDAVSPALCRSVANNGVAPFCSSSFTWVAGVTAQHRLPNYYLQIRRGQPLKIEGTLTCHLNADQIHAQHYVGPLHGEWVEPARLKAVNLPDGPAQLEVGTVMLSAPGVKNISGQPYREPKTTVVF
jgi:hypothetical protein